MPVVQISRIQHRRGLQENLPNLASAELGWSVDSQRLFIGNGLAEEGSPPSAAGRRTEILTENSRELILELLNIYQYKGLPAGFVAQTGETSLDYFSRSLQEKLDDFVNVRDFGALGDGIADDTDAINRALNNTYAYSNFLVGTSHHRTIHFPAGKYMVSGIIRVPPFVKLKGEGKLSTVIDGTIDGPMLVFYDSSEQTAGDFGSAVGLLNTNASDYVFEDIGFINRHPDKTPVISAEGGRGVTFNRVSFGGSQQASDAGDALVMINNTSTEIPSSNIFFNQCDFYDHRSSIKTQGDVIGVSMTQCYFSGLRQSWDISEETMAFSVTDSIFSDISIDGVDYTGATVEGTQVKTSGKHLTLNDNTTSAVIAMPMNFTELTVTYSLKRGSNYRNGTLRMTGNGTTFIDDDYTESSDIGVTFSRNGSGNLVYTTTSTGADATMKYQIEFYLTPTLQLA